MFPKLYRKIFYTLFFVCLVLVFAIDVTAITVVHKSTKEYYTAMGEQKTQQIAKSCAVYVDSVLTTVSALPQSEILLGELVAPSGASFTAMLDGICNYARQIDAITVYAVNGNVYSSSRIDPIPFSALMQNAEIADFVRSDREFFLSLRTEQISNIYHNAVYPAELGVLSCVQKVYDSESVVGYIFADVLPGRLYEEAIPTADAKNVPFLVYGGKFFPCERNASFTQVPVPDRENFVFCAECGAYGFSVVISESAESCRADMLSMDLITVFGSLVALAIAYFASRYTARSVTARLDKFLQKMDEEIYRF